MKGGLKPQGFTIVETLIFLAISGAMFVSVFTFISGRQSSAEFSYGIQEFATRISDITNDVSTGYYDRVGDFSCTVSGAGEPTLSTAVADQGTNKDCIFIGRAIQFDPEGVPDIPDEQGYTVYSVIGRRTVNSGGEKREVFSLSESRTIPITPTTFQPSAPDASASSTIPNGIKVKWLRYATSEGGALSNNVGAVGIFTNFGVYNLSGNSNAQSVRNVQIIPVLGTQLNKPKNETADSIRAIAGGSIPASRGGVVACLQSPKGNLHAFITIGGNVRQATTDIEIQNGVCPP